MLYFSSQIKHFLKEQNKNLFKKRERMCRKYLVKLNSMVL